jgi:hypothetical protein
MNVESHKKFFLMPGQLLGLTLIGLLLVSAFVYYKNVKAQRYLEPTLAIAQPRIKFAKNLGLLIEKEFGSKNMKGVVHTASSIFVDEALLFKEAPEENIPDTIFIQRLSQLFLSILQDPQMRTHFDLILVSTRLPISPHLDMNKRQRNEIQHKAELILYSLYNLEPTLEKEYGIYFAATAVPVEPLKADNWVEFRIIPSEHLHIEMIKSLEKYFF